MSDMTRQSLLEKLQKTMVRLLDERSMISQQLLGTLEGNVWNTAHEVSNVNQGWGGIPVVVIFGDDCQLPSVACNGATAVIISQVGEYKSLSKNKKNEGMMQFLSLSESIIELDEVVCRATDQNYYKSMLGRLRFGWTKSSGRERLKTLALDEDNYSRMEIEDLTSGALHLFAKHANRLAYSEKKWPKLRQMTINWLLSRPRMKESSRCTNICSSRHLTSRKRGNAEEPWLNIVRQIC
jgi:hypothetical protein